MPHELEYVTYHHPDDIILVKSKALSDEHFSTFIDKHCGDGFDKKEYINFFKRLFEDQIKAGEEKIRGYRKDIMNIIDSNVYCLVGLRFTSIKTKVLEPRVKKTEGIAMKFASLKTIEDIKSFAKEYGLLGVLVPYKSTGLLNVLYRGITSPNYYYGVFEPLSVWKYYIQHIRGLTKLYQILSDPDLKETDVIGVLSKHESYDSVAKFIAYDHNGDSIHVSNFLIPGFNQDEEVDKQKAIKLLGNSLQGGLYSAINVSFSDVIPSKYNRLGFKIKETYTTHYLLAAIYYDLWRMMAEDQDVIFCGYCGRALPKKGKKMYCNNSCKQMAYRKRKQKKQKKKDKPDVIF
ncbi:hypothetical protein J2S00_002490 [Caldalkalibacillus uzonensis]|uniref:CGNR zinc finger domain-containing protein n=1 Tax=Caldalkalibacillus uzonensis TaxID=353224 RepID=A0ABU0CTF1_9BACI|nr:hypothetical protein [Caldalkalibacillus uzonensis]MDQ0339697.1 hypothetical protein [Caldalkalibacillus uzonensis]